MKLRSLTAAAGSLALTGALLFGAAAPASAYVVGLVTLPTCATMVSSSTVSLWGVTPTWSESPVVGATRYGTLIASLKSLIDARQHRTCSWTRNGKVGTISEVRIATGDFATIRAAYLAAGYTESAPHLATMPGSPTDRVFRKPGKTGPGEFAMLSPDGWWITATDNGAGVIGSFTYEAIDTFLTLNPHLR